MGSGCISPNANLSRFFCDTAQNQIVERLISDETFDVIDGLLLPRYELGRYLDSTYRPKTEVESTQVKNLQQARSGNLTGITRVAFYKRLSSSVEAFRLTLQRHILRNKILSEALSCGKEIPHGNVIPNWDDSPEDTDGGRIATYTQEANAEGKRFWLSDDLATKIYRKLRRARPNSIDWYSPSLFKKADLLKDLASDTQQLETIEQLVRDWEATQDTKIAELVALLRDRHPDEKVLIFTEYADTAHYIHQALCQYKISGVEKVTGATDDPQAIVARFAPVSNSASTVRGAPVNVLVSTDVLAEGHNLQDSHIVVNFDLPWAIIKIMQRAGRVDRIGQSSQQVYIYSLVDDSVEHHINLRGRIAARLRANAQLLGSEETFFGDPQETNYLGETYTESLERDDLHDLVPPADPLSCAFRIWEEAEKHHPDLAEKVKSLPDGVWAARCTADASKDPSVLVLARNPSGSSVFLSRTASGSGMLDKQEALSWAECNPSEPRVQPAFDHHGWTEDAVRHHATQNRDWRQANEITTKHRKGIDRLRGFLGR